MVTCIYISAKKTATVVDHLLQLRSLSVHTPFMNATYFVSVTRLLRKYDCKSQAQCIREKIHIEIIILKSLLNTRIGCEI